MSGPGHDACERPSDESPDGTPRGILRDVSPTMERRGCLSVVLGILTVLVGIPMLICPGPGMAVIAAGFGMIAVGLGLRKTKRS